MNQVTSGTPSAAALLREYRGIVQKGSDGTFKDNQRVFVGAEMSTLDALRELAKRLEKVRKDVELLRLDYRERVPLVWLSGGGQRQPLRTDLLLPILKACAADLSVTYSEFGQQKTASEILRETFEIVRSGRNEILGLDHWFFEEVKPAMVEYLALLNTTAAAETAVLRAVGNADVHENLPSQSTTALIEEKDPSGDDKALGKTRADWFHRQLQLQEMERKDFLDSPKAPDSKTLKKWLDGVQSNRTATTRRAIGDVFKINVSQVP